jgi:UDP-2-acetamido-2,6-beta-L-arabino-hexul-4-ose reductase
MKVLITGASGFVAHNLRVHLSERDDTEAILFTRKQSIDELSDLLEGVDFIFHLAGVNRPKDDIEFVEGNIELTETLCHAIRRAGRLIPVIYTSSIQAEVDNPYGKSKLAAEKALLDFSKKTGSPVHIFRLPNVFGKWCKPNYNSAVATFCHNISHDLPIQINDPSACIRLVYIDDVVRRFISVMDGAIVDNGFCGVDPVYEITVGELVEKLTAYKASRDSLVVGRVGAGLDRALYSTYLSYLDADQFSYDLIKHEDPRGLFVEMLKTQDSGQFSYFTAHPGITRGGHYHHTKNEKFLVLKGEAVFKFRQIVTNDYYELTASGEQPIVVETVPGWTHDITNVGTDEMIVMLWANEVFDPDAPDTFAKAL